MKKTYLIILLTLAAFAFARADVVHRIIVDGVINPVATEYIIESIEEAGAQNAELLIIEMDTPGGMMNSMHEIMKAIQNASVPVAVYVAPSGSRAGSAGVFITYAAHIAAMAPGTNIGSAHPVFGGGMPGSQPDSVTSETMMEKVVNDAVAKIKTIAERRGRNVEWAEKAIRESANITEREALELNVIEFVVPSVDSLLSAIDGLEIELDDGASKILNTKDARVITFEMTWRQRLLDTIADPNVMFILLMVGIYGILYEIISPGTILPGVVGGISIILWLFAMQTLPVNYAGVLLIIFAVILFLLEIKIPSFGLLTIGGVASLVFGGIMLIDSPLPFLQVSWEVILTVVVLSVLFFVFAVGLTIRIYRKKPTTGSQGMIGETGIVYKALHPEGTVKIHGEYWKAYSDKKIKKNTKVKVVDYDGVNLIIKVEAL